MLNKIITEIQRYTSSTGKLPKYICLGQLELIQLSRETFTKPAPELIEVKYGKIYGTYILPIDRDTFCEAV